MKIKFHWYLLVFFLVIFGSAYAIPARDGAGWDTGSGGSASQDYSDISLSGTTTLDGPVTVGQELGAALITQTCAAWGLTSPVGAWSCAGDTITRTASGSDLTITNTGLGAAVGLFYRVRVTTATVTAGTVTPALGGASGTAISTAGVSDQYWSAISTAKMTLVANSAFAGTITVSSIFANSVSSSITTGEGPLVITRTLASATENETGVAIVSNQTGAAGDKATLRVENIGSGTGNENIQEWWGGGFQRGNITATGYLSVFIGVSAPLYQNSAAATTTTPVIIGTSTATTASSGAINVMKLYPTYNNTGTTSSIDLLIARTETALGSGTQKFVSLQAGAAGTTEMFSVNRIGIIGHYNGTTVTAAATIIPSGPQFHVNGTTAIVNITAPTECTSGCEITIIPDAIFTTTTAGNIALATTAVVNKALRMLYDATTVKWVPSY